MDLIALENQRIVLTEVCLGKGRNFMWLVILGNVNQLSFTPSTPNTVDLLSLLHPLHSCQLSTFTVSKMEPSIRKREKRWEFLYSELQKSRLWNT